MSVVTRTDAKAHLNITVDTYDAELDAFLNRVEAAIGRRIGPLAPVAKTERVRGMTNVLRLSFTPIISLTTVTAIEGTTIDVNQLTTPPGGRVEFKQYGYFASRWYDVVYQAGWAAVPDDLKLDVLELLRRFWGLSQRGGARRPGSSSEQIPQLSRTVEEPLFGQLIDQLTMPYKPILGA